MLKEFLDSKPLYYDEIDYTRMPRVYEKIKDCFSNQKIIHLIGTNGKGTTGRFLASALYKQGFKTAHYTSPHILEFNERIWIDSKNVSDELLDDTHKELQELLTSGDSDTLSYFEYTTILAMRIFKDCEYVVLEAGLGGEYDATAVFPKYLTLVTPIDIDHEAFLGETIEKIARTKLNAIQKNAILSNQKFDDVYDIAKDIQSKTDAKIFRIDEFIDESDIQSIENISKKLGLVDYLKNNLKFSISALKFLGLGYRESDFYEARLFGRLSRISKNIIVDVGHNPLAAKSVLNALSGEKFILIYNSYKDKDYHKILQILKPLIINVEILQLCDERVESVETLQSTLKDLEIEYVAFDKIKADSNYLVFGSFSVVEAFLREYNG